MPMPGGVHRSASAGSVSSTATRTRPASAGDSSTIARHLAKVRPVESSSSGAQLSTIDEIRLTFRLVRVPSSGATGTAISPAYRQPRNAMWKSRPGSKHSSARVPRGASSPSRVASARALRSRSARVSASHSVRPSA